MGFVYLFSLDQIALLYFIISSASWVIIVAAVTATQCILTYTRTTATPSVIKSLFS